MTKKKNDDTSFVFYRSFYDVVNLIPDAAMRCRAYAAICEYAFSGVEPAEDEDVLVKMVFTQAKPQIDANNKRRESASAGGIAKKKMMEAKKAAGDVPAECHTRAEGVPTMCQVGAEGVPNVNATENFNENENHNCTVYANEHGNTNPHTVQTAAPFTPPTVEDVQAYIAEQSLRVDANRFVDYYTANGWMVGKNKMRNWKAALRHWSRGDDRNAAKGRDYDYNPRMKGGSTYGGQHEPCEPAYGLCL